MHEGLEILPRIVIGSLLLMTATAKWRYGVAHFERAIQGYRILPFGSALAARALVGAEAAIGALLIAGAWPELVAVCAAALLSAFAAAMTVSLQTGAAADCGCHLFGRERISWRLVYRNIALAALLAIGAGGGAVVVLLIAAATAGVLAPLHFLVAHPSTLPKFVGGD